MHDAPPSAGPVIADTLSEFAVRLRYEDIPQVIREQAKHHLLDIVGICHAATENEFAGKTLAALRRFGGGDSDIIGMRERLSLRDSMLMNGALAHAIGPAMRRKMPYDPVKDFATLSQVASGHNVLAVHPSLPVKSVKELLALARAKPGQLTYGSGGVGTTTHIAGELFKSLGKVDLVHVPHKGGGPLSIALLSGEISISFGSIATVLPQVRAGRQRALAVTGAARAQAMATLPTVAEAGIAGYEMNSWYGVLAPAATPRDIVQRLSAEIARIIKLPETRERLAHEGQEAAGTTADEFATYLRSEVEKWARVVKSSGVPIE